MKLIHFLLCGLLTLPCFADAQVSVTAVTAQQRYPWNGLVDITVTIQGTAEDVAEAECFWIAMNRATKATIPVMHITQNGADSGSGSTWTRKFIWDAKADVGSVKIDDIALTVDAMIHGGVQLWENGPYWAECNVGASQPWQSGYYFWWGDTVGYKRNSANNGWMSAKDGSSFSFRKCPTSDKDNSQLQSAGYIDAAGNLVAKYDAATAYLGTPWRMPTAAEVDALCSNCTTTLTTRNGESGLLVTGKGAYASKSIFLPAAGYSFDSNLFNFGVYGDYWSSTSDSDDSDYAWRLEFNSLASGVPYRYFSYRYSGRPVRSVRGLTNAGVTTCFALDCCEGTREIPANGVELRYDASWYAGADSVRVTDDGTIVAEGVAGSSVWRPEPSPISSTRYIIKLEALKGGRVVATETAEYAFGYVRNVTARQLWPHKKVEVCYEIADDIHEVADGNSRIELSCSNGANVRTIIGDAMATPGKHQIVWDFEADDASVANEKVAFTVKVGRSDEVKNWDLSFDEGGVLAYEQGFLTKTFSNPSLTFDTTSDIWDGCASRSTAASVIQASSLAEHTTVAYGTYMRMKKGVKYNFKGKYDDFVMVRIGNDQLLKNNSECAEASGSYTPSASGWYRVEFRVGNNGGAGGVTSSSYCGIKWNSSSDSTWRNVENTASLVMFALPTQVITVGAMAASEATPIDWGSGMSVTSNGGWTEDPENFYEGRPALKSKSIGNSSSTSYVVQLQYCSKLEFAWKASSEANYDYLNLYVDGILKDRIAGETDWRSSSVVFDDLAIHEVRWTYEKDQYTVGGSDCGWVSVGRCDCYGGDAISGSAVLGYSPIDAREVRLQIDGTTVLTSEESGEYTWMPRTLGTHTLKHIAGSNVWIRTVNVTELEFATPPSPNPPTAADANITIRQTSHSFTTAGGTYSIPTAGVNGYTGNFAVSKSDDWITINSAEANWKAGRPLVYGVTANNGVEERVGYVYVSGHVHTITQAGVGAELSAYSADFESEGGEGRVTVLADAGIGWHARPNADWISVSPTSGSGEGDVTFAVAPWNEVSTRTATITVAGQTFTVNQTGRHMRIDQDALPYDYNAHVAALTVTALSSTEWDVEPCAPWISVVDAGKGKGGGNVTLAVAENPSYLPRTGTARIGTETVTVTQTGRPTAALSFAIDPERTGASVKGANGLVSVTATPDLPWSAKSGANWLTVMSSFASGAGNGNVVYTASPNPTMAERTGTITVTPEAKSGLAARTHTVVQPAATSMIAADGHEFAADGDSFEVGVSVAENVGWSIVKGPDWVTVDGSTSRVGPGAVKIAVSENLTVDPREATVVIAGHEFRIVQPGRTVEVEYTAKIVPTVGGDGAIKVHPDGNVRWTATPSDWDWIAIWGDEYCDCDEDGNILGEGDGTVYYYVSEYVGDGTPRTGWITIGDQVVYLTQRPYDLTINPSAVQVSGNAGAGEVGVPAPAGEVWNAIATEPWITVVEGYDAGTGSGTVRYTFKENDTGKTRTGRIIIAGEEYEVRQAARQLVKIEVEVQGGGGEVEGAGTYDLGAEVMLTAVAADGYEFVGWTGLDGEGAVVTQNPLNLTADVDKHVMAEFRHIPVYVVNGETVREGTVKQFAAPEPQTDEKGTTKLVCKGTSAFPDKGSSFSLKITEDVAFEWNLWETNYLLTIESPVHGKIMEGSTVAATHWVKAGETVTLTAVPDSGYTFFRWYTVPSRSPRLALASGAVTTPVAEGGDGTVSFGMDGPTTIGAIFGVFNDTLSDALGAKDLIFTAGGDANWAAVVDATTASGYTSVRSGAIGKESETWLETTVEGSGELSFNWRVDCEKDDGGTATWDRLSVFVNGVEAARIDGKTDWQRVTLPVNGKTTVRWSFYRDDWDEAPPGCANGGWIDGVIWTGKEGK